jgi:two-component system cell cycle response regulator DivK
LSGLDATRQLTTEAATRHIPIIVITSYALSGDREKALQAGAASYLAKPYSPSELLAMVKQFLPDI